MKGRVYLVGAGPGDPGLLTLRGKELLGRANVVVFDHLVSNRLLDYAPPAAERIYVGKQASDHTLSQDQINKLLVERASRGQVVVRLKGGDPFVFGRGGEEALALAEAGISFEVVPGVTAAVAAAAYAGIPVTHRQIASSLALITGHETPDKDEPSLDWKVLAAWEGTLAFYMGLENLEPICRRLVAEGMAPGTPAAAIRWGTTPRQRTVTGTVASLPQDVQKANLQPPAVILVGKVVALREKLAWFEKRPLLGRRIVVTRARATASTFAARLEELGAEVIEAPAIRIEPLEDPSALRQAAAEAGNYDWIVFTSASAAGAFFGALHDAGLDARALASCRIAAIGPATAERLGHFGIRPDVRPREFTTAAVVEALAATGKLSGARVLCPRSDVAPPDLVKGLTQKGATVREVTAYRTVSDETGAEQVAGLLRRKQVDWLTFTSSSTVKSLITRIGPEVTIASSARIASIGPMTSATLRQLGLAPTVEARRHDIPGLVEAILSCEAEGAR